MFELRFLLQINYCGECRSWGSAIAALVRGLVGCINRCSPIALDYQVQYIHTSCTHAAGQNSENDHTPYSVRGIDILWHWVIAVQAWVL